MDKLEKIAALIFKEMQVDRLVLKFLMEQSDRDNLTLPNLAKHEDMFDFYSDCHCEGDSLTPVKDLIVSTIVSTRRDLHPDIMDDLEESNSPSEVFDILKSYYDKPITVKPSDAFDRALVENAMSNNLL